jgi:hypothetical protein
MADSVWIVEVQAQSSWEETLTDNYVVSSVHRTKEGAERAAATAKKDTLIGVITGGEIEVAETGPDEILGAVENYSEDIAKQLRAELAKPGAQFLESVKVVAKRAFLPIPGVQCREHRLQD